MNSGLPEASCAVSSRPDVGVERQIRHRAVTARQVDRVVVLEADVRQLERPPHHLRGTDDRLQLEGAFRAARHLGAQAHHVDVRGHAVRRRDHDLVAGVGDDLVRVRELLGPVTGRVPRAVLQHPVGGSADDEQYLRHRAILLSLPWEASWCPTVIHRRFLLTEGLLGDYGAHSMPSRTIVCHGRSSCWPRAESTVPARCSRRPRASIKARAGFVMLLDQGIAAWWRGGL